MAVAREDNPGVPDRSLRQYWAQNYSDIDPRTLPTWETFLPAAKADNPGVSEKALKTYWDETYGDFGASEKEDRSSDVARGFKESFQRWPVRAGLRPV